MLGDVSCGWGIERKAADVHAYRKREQDRTSVVLTAELLSYGGPMALCQWLLDGAPCRGEFSEAVDGGLGFTACECADAGCRSRYCSAEHGNRSFVLSNQCIEVTELLSRMTGPRL